MTIAAVVDTDIPPHTVPLVLHVDDEIRRPLPAARLDLRIRLDAREIVRQPDAAIKRTFFHKFARANADLTSNRSFVEIGCIIDNNIVIAPRHNRKIHNTVLEILRRKVGKCNEVALRVQILRDLLRLRLKLRQRRLRMAMCCEHIRQLRLCHRILTRERIACDPYTLFCHSACFFGRSRKRTDIHCRTERNKKARGVSSNTLHTFTVLILTFPHRFTSLR